jgi:hypothetical protein
MIVQCPVTGELSTFPNHKGLLAHRLVSLSKKWEIALEDLFIIMKITAELGEDWFEDSLEFNDHWELATSDNTLLKMAQRGECDLSVMELIAIRDRAREFLQLLLRHETDPKKRKWIEEKLQESEVSKANRALAKALLEKQGMNDARKAN